jgi:hypothetical protein
MNFFPYVDNREQKSYNISGQVHKMLRDQLASVLTPICNRLNQAVLAELIFESILTWTTTGKPFKDIYSIIGLLL